MSEPAGVKARLAEGGIVAVLRASDASHFVRVALELVAVGVTALEVTLTAPQALQTLTAIKRETPDDVVVGAGTVLTEREAAACIHAGADFLVAPTLVPQVVRLGLATSTPVYPGAFTPTEFLEASRMGVDLVKLFPAGVVEPGYLRALNGPLPEIDIMPTGGIGLEDVTAWLDAGATVVGLGGPLLGDALDGGSVSALHGRARAVLDSVRASRAEG